MYFEAVLTKTQAWSPGDKYVFLGLLEMVNLKILYTIITEVIPTRLIRDNCLRVVHILFKFPDILSIG